MKYLLFDIVAGELAKTLDFPVGDIHARLEQPPSSDMGDVAFPCFFLAKEYKKAPPKIAEELQEKLSAAGSQMFSEIRGAGGYLNFFLAKDKVLKLFYDIAIGDLLIDDSEHQGQSVTIEHTSVNPNASPHIGRARNAMIGDASVRLLRYLGCDVTVHYFVNDIGKQIALLAYCTKDKGEISFNELLSLYVAANEELKSNPELEKEVFEILNRMESGDQKVFADFARIVDICIKGQTAIFNEFGIYYDIFDYESRYVQSGRTAEVLSLLEQTGRLFADEEGRLILNLEEFQINPENPYLPLTRKDKTSLYPLRDICYNIDKVNEKSARNIVVLGEDQRLYGRQINAALTLLGYDEAEIINYSFVLLPDGKMSTRAGQVVLLEDLMRDTVEFARQTIAEHRGPAETSRPDNVESLPKQLAYGAIKYSILKCGNEKNVIFDRETALNFQGDTSVYIQYSYARIQSLLRGEKESGSSNAITSLTHPLEWEVIKKLLSFHQVLAVISQDFNFVTLCAYLYELCQLFSRWYKECTIKNAAGDVKLARLFLAAEVAKVIKDGLGILGIEAPERI